MSELSNVDRLNIIFFGEMEIPVDEKKRRIAFAKALQAVLWNYYDTIHTILEISFSNDAESAIVPLAVAAAALEREYKRLIEKYYPEVADIAPDWVIAHTKQFSVWTTQTCQNGDNRPIMEQVTTSGRTEVNTVGNLALLLAAANGGKRFKRWKTFGDSKVRPTHRESGGQVVPIEKPFNVGGYSMMFPGGSSLGAPAKEIVNCRCSVEYF